MVDSAKDNSPSLPKKKVEKAEAETEAMETIEPEEELAFRDRMLALGQLIRDNYQDLLKFDSSIDNISYDYVDTQQYKLLLGKTCDLCGIGFNFDVYDKNIDVRETGSTLTIIASVSAVMTFYGKNDGESMSIETVGFGLSKGSGHALTNACTNAMRIGITDTFLLATNDRDSDDVKNLSNAKDYLTQDQKKEKKKELLDKTKNEEKQSTILYGEVLRDRAKSVIDAQAGPAEFRTILEKFLENKYDENGKPLPFTNDPNETRWIVTVDGANKLMGDIDQYA